MRRSYGRAPRQIPEPDPSLDGPFVALDFETANPSPDSACAIGLVACEGGMIVERQRFLIRTPTPLFTFTWCHGIEWRHVKDEPTFAELRPRILEILSRGAFIAAHNASFDRRVLEACLGAPAPKPFVCTMQLARRTWNLRPTKLGDCARFLDIELNHHEALSDAEACARIVLAAAKAAPPAARPSQHDEPLDPVRAA